MKYLMLLLAVIDGMTAILVGYTMYLFGIDMSGSIIFLASIAAGLYCMYLSVKGIK